MKLKFSVFFFLICFLIIPSLGISASESSNFITYSNGVKKSISTETIDIPGTNRAEVIVTHGKPSILKIDVNEDKLVGTLEDIDTNRTYFLEGVLVNRDENNTLFYKGNVDNDETKVFIALLTKDEHNKYETSITIEQFNENNEVEFGESFSFGNSDNSKQRVNHSIITKESNNSVSSMYNHLLGGSKGFSHCCNCPYDLYKWTRT